MEESLRISTNLVPSIYEGSHQVYHAKTHDYKGTKVEYTISLRSDEQLPKFYLYEVSTSSKGTFLHTFKGRLYFFSSEPNKADGSPLAIQFDTSKQTLSFVTPSFSVDTKLKSKFSLLKDLPFSLTTLPEDSPTASILCERHKKYGLFSKYISDFILDREIFSFNDTLYDFIEVVIRESKNDSESLEIKLTLNPDFTYVLSFSKRIFTEQNSSLSTSKSEYKGHLQHR